MASHQISIQINPDFGSFLDEKTEFSFYENRLARVQTKCSEREMELTSDVQTASHQDALIKKNSIFLPQDSSGTAQPSNIQPRPFNGDLFVGSFYWQKTGQKIVHINRVNSQTFLSRPHFATFRNEEQTTLGSEGEKPAENIELEYGQDSQWFDMDCCQFQKCLSV